jgi:UDP-glucose 4-epimerase
VKDIAAANAFFATQSAATGVFNVAYGQRTTINDLARTICRLTGSRSDIRYEAERAGDVKHSVADIGKLRAAGFSPVTDFDGGLDKTVEFFRGKSS